MTTEQKHRLGLAHDAPAHCPYCGSADHLALCSDWTARSTEPDDSKNETTITEYQCMSDLCEGRSFWC